MTEPVAGGAFDRHTIQRLLRVIRGFGGSEVGGRAKALAGLLLAFLVVINALNVLNSYVGRDFMTAIERRNHAAFLHQALLYAAVFAASTVAAVLYRFVEERLGLLWRGWFTRRLTDRYLADHFYHHLTVVGSLGNPDQRIADDVRSFTATTLSLGLIFLNGTLTVLAFSGVLWSISRPLFATAVLYATVGSALAYAVGRPLVRLNYTQSDREADFRAQLVHVRENAQSIALLGVEPQLKTRLFAQIDALTDNLRRIIAVNRNLGFFTTGYNYLIQLIPALVVAPLFIRGSAEFGVIPQSAMAFAQLIGAFSLIINQFPQLSSYAAVVARLNALGEAHELLPSAGAGTIAFAEDDTRLAFEQLTLRSSPEERTLVQALSLEVQPGDGVLIAVPDVLVMAALVRAVAGLPVAGSGRVVRPGPEQLRIIGERPYLPPGSLRVLLLGGERQPAGEQRVWELLRSLGVDGAVHRAGGLDVERDWNTSLSLDEQRLIAVAYLLATPQRFAVFAHPETALGAERVSDVLEALHRHGVGTVAITDGALARAPVGITIEIAPDGTWTRQPPSGRAALNPAGT